MSSSATNNEETRDNTHVNYPMACELKEQGRYILKVETNTSASFTNQARSSTSSGFVFPVSVLPVVTTSEHIASTSDRESDIPSDINNLVSEAHSVNEHTQENGKSIIEIF